MENVIGLLDYSRQLLGEWLQSSVSFKLFDRARVNSFHLACYVRSLSFLLIFMSIESIAFERCYNCFRDDSLHGTLLSHPHLTPTNLASQIAALRHLYVRCMQIFN